MLGWCSIIISEWWASSRMVMRGGGEDASDFQFREAFS
jgi:hypothetical protein